MGGLGSHYAIALVIALPSIQERWEFILAGLVSAGLAEAKQTRHARVSER